MESKSISEKWGVIVYYKVVDYKWGFWFDEWWLEGIPPDWRFYNYANGGW